MRTYYVYLLASHNKVLYCGVTNDLHRRVAEHKQGDVPGFTSRYNV
ncbi:MAG: GIY-YIG nuclease family protein, partial [Bacteroidota bacterium]